MKHFRILYFIIKVIYFCSYTVRIITLLDKHISLYPSCLSLFLLELQPSRLMLSDGSSQVPRRARCNASRSHNNTVSISYWCRNIFITLPGESGQAESLERRAEGERGSCRTRCRHRRDTVTCSDSLHWTVPCTTTWNKKMSYKPFSDPHPQLLRRHTRTETKLQQLGPQV